MKLLFIFYKEQINHIKLHQRSRHVPPTDRLNVTQLCYSKKKITQKCYLNKFNTKMLSVVNRFFVMKVTMKDGFATE